MLGLKRPLGLKMSRPKKTIQTNRGLNPTSVSGKKATKRVSPTPTI
jgi:hypothetical protein